MKPKISIVVPIYNVDEYLSRCLDSLLSQTIEDIEVITINDGSTDNSLEILEQYAKKDSRIIIIDKENGGVSSARNAGLKIAVGDYIGFVDPDDWVNQEMYRSMYDIAMKDKADIVMCSYIREFGSHSKVKNFPLPKKVIFQEEDVRFKLLRRLVGPIKDEVAKPELLDAWGTVWSKLYRRELIMDNQVTFTDLSEIGTNEDSLFNVEVIYYAKSFVFINEHYYHYWRANDASVTTGYKPALVDKYTNLYEKIEAFLEKKKLEPEFYIALNNRISLNTLGLGLNEISKGNKSSVLRKISKIKTILNNQQIRRSFQHFKVGDLPLVWRMFYFFAKLRFSTLFYLMLMSIEVLRKLIR
ncbi:glycosyltransferase EpsH [Evansella vedderi]|uniref:Glycosyltransferase EpsH n=1 Tax=Evansella vedderi TaxID=38282 RepID=A0ABT9ZPJ4_9BACI|nr:glycosyltransferase [Evansella vedderi]MDQ0253157.1 glycosyltransferase EpsH [Evansella vedderi]